MHKMLPLLTSFILFGCSTPPRVTTQEERDAAIVAINSAKSAVLLLRIEQSRKDLAVSQLDRLRARIDESATVPISWITWWSDLQTFGVEWAVKVQERPDR